MSTKLKAGTSTSGAVLDADTTGILELQSGSTPTTAVTINTSQNVGIGTASPSTKLDVTGVVNASANISTSAGNFVLGTNDTYVGFASNHVKFNNTSDRFTVNTAATERMRIASDGGVFIGCTTRPTSATGGACFSVQTNGRRYLELATTTTSSTALQEFINGNGTVGSISVSGSATTYSTSSDYRLKENITPMTGALAKVSLLKPVTYKWKVDGSNGEGFIADELQAIIPDCVTGEKDAVDEQGKPIYQGIDTSFLVATLTSAIQELNAKVDAQATTIAELQARTA